MKLMSVTESEDNKHKYVAIFDNDGRKKTVRFGSKGMDDYTITHDKEQRERYRKRHAKDLKGDPSRAGYLSYYVLWGDSTNINTNIRKYMTMFDL